jgi:hypothetical protein
VPFLSHRLRSGQGRGKGNNFRNSVIFFILFFTPSPALNACALPLSRGREGDGVINSEIYFLSCILLLTGIFCIYFACKTIVFNIVKFRKTLPAVAQRLICSGKIKHATP